MIEFRARACWMGLGRRYQALVRQLSAFTSDRQAAVSVQFAVLLVPLIALAGGSIDVGNVFRIRAVLQNASDAASVGSVAVASPGYVAAQSMSLNGSIAVGVTDATSLFNANTAALLGTTAITPAVSYTKASLQLTSKISWTAVVPMTFLGITGQSTWTLAGTSTSTAAMPLYLDFYLMVDVSGSMGLPSTQSEQTRLAAVNTDDHSDYPGGCVFACHMAGYIGYTMSRDGGHILNPLVTSCPTAGTSACIQLRTDAVGTAIQQLLQTAQSSEMIANQYRIGLYPFIAYLKTYYALTSNISATGIGTLAAAAGSITSLLDTGIDATLGSGGTHFENALVSMNQIITSVGTGTSQTNTLPYVFLITDGSQDNQYYWNGSWTGSNQATTLNTANCTSLKNRGVKIAILYIPYQTIENPTSFANGEDYAANSNIPYIPASLTSCASTNFFFTANTPADITTALTAMFSQALTAARITN